jgi:GTP-binding protein YchF
MELGLIGLPRAGKTTLFGALTGLAFDVAAARQSHTAVVKVPDPRIDRLSGMFRPRKTTLAEVTFVDPAGERHESGAERVAFPETMAAALRDVDALVHVVRAFQDPSVPAAPGSSGPAGDVEAIEQELVLRDLTLVERRLERLRKERKPENAAEQALLEPAFAHLDAARPLRELPWGDEQWGRLRGFQFLSSKPALVVLNIGEEDLARPDAGVPAGLERFQVLRLCAKVEREIAELGPEDQREFLAQMGLEHPARDVFIRAAYDLLRLVSFFTVGDDEVRAWPVPDGASAWVAAGKIHSDIQRGFIRAEAIHYEDFVRCGSMAAAKTQGLLRLEGKEYRVRDGDILHFRFSV